MAHRGHFEYIILMVWPTMLDSMWIFVNILIKKFEFGVYLMICTPSDPWIHQPLRVEYYYIILLWPRGSSVYMQNIVLGLLSSRNSYCNFWWFSWVILSNSATAESKSKYFLLIWLLWGLNKRFSAGASRKSVGGIFKGPNPKWPPSATLKGKNSKI